MDESLRQEARTAAQKAVRLLRFFEKRAVFLTERALLQTKAIAHVSTHHFEKLLQRGNPQRLQHGGIRRNRKAQPAPCRQALAKQGNLVLPLLALSFLRRQVDLLQHDRLSFPRHADGIADAKPAQGARDGVACPRIGQGKRMERHLLKMRHRLAPHPLLFAQGRSFHARNLLPESLKALRLSSDHAMEKPRAHGSLDRAAGNVRRTARQGRLTNDIIERFPPIALCRQGSDIRLAQCQRTQFRFRRAPAKKPFPETFSLKIPALDIRGKIIQQRSLFQEDDPLRRIEEVHLLPLAVVQIFKRHELLTRADMQRGDALQFVFLAHQSVHHASTPA